MLQDKEKLPLWVKAVNAVLIAIALFYAVEFVRYLWNLNDFLLAQGY